MELQTWTRKSNAIKAVQAMLAKANLPDDVLLTGVDAEDVSNGIGDAAYAATVYVEGGTSEAIDLLREVCGDKAKVVFEGEPTEQQMRDADAENFDGGDEQANFDGASQEAAPKQVRAPSVNRQSNLPSDAGLKVNGGKHAANPYREGTKSHAAFALIQDNPGITRAEFIERGGRARTLSEEVKAGRVRVG